MSKHPLKSIAIYSATLAVALSFGAAKTSAVNPPQNLFVSGLDGSDIGIISEVSPIGTVTTFATGLGTPQGLAFDTSGNLFAADSGNGANGNGVIYQFTPAQVNAGSGTGTVFANGLSQPAGLAYYAGNLWEADGSDNVNSFTSGGSKTTTGIPHNPSGIAFDSVGDLFIANHNHSTITEIAVGGSQSTSASGLVNAPYGLAYDTSGNLYEADFSTGTINEFLGGVVSSGTEVTYATGLDDPEGITFDSFGNLYVANNGDGTITKIAPGDTSETTYASGLRSPTYIAFGPVPVPEPSTLALCWIGTIALIVARRRTPNRPNRQSRRNSRRS